MEREVCRTLHRFRPVIVTLDSHSLCGHGTLKTNSLRYSFYLLTFILLFWRMDRCIRHLCWLYNLLAGCKTRKIVGLNFLTFSLESLVDLLTCNLVKALDTFVCTRFLP